VEPPNVICVIGTRFIIAAIDDAPVAFAVS
jgi:hypothetical protein